MSKPYWIIGDAIIFKPDFNDSLDDYTQIISNYENIYFSNFNDPQIVLENNNTYNFDNFKSFSNSYFNHPLNNSLSNLTNLKVLNFGNGFNQPLIKFFDNKNENERQLDNSLSNLVNLRELTFGTNFN